MSENVLSVVFARIRLLGRDPEVFLKSGLGLCLSRTCISGMGSTDHNHGRTRQQPVQVPHVAHCRTQLLKGLLVVGTFQFNECASLGSGIKNTPVLKETASTEDRKTKEFRAAPESSHLIQSPFLCSVHGAGGADDSQNDKMREAFMFRIFREASQTRRQSLRRRHPFRWIQSGRNPSTKGKQHSHP